MTRIRDGEAVPDSKLPVEIVVSPGAPRGCHYIEPAPLSVRDAMPGAIDAPHYYENKRYRLRSDENGLLLCGDPPASPDYSIVVFGESTIEDRYIEEPLRCVSIARTELEKLTSLKIDMRNASVSGVHSMHSILMLLTKVIPLRPDAVVLVQNINDLKQLMYFGSYWTTYGNHTFLYPKAAQQPAAARPLPFRVMSAAARRLRALARRLLPQSASASQPIQEKKQKMEWWEYSVPQQGLALTDFETLSGNFRSSMEAFVGVCRAWGIKPVLATQPNRITGTEPPDATIRTQMAPLFELGLDYQSYARLYHGFNATIREVATQLDVPLIDLEQHVPKEPALIWDSVHLTPAGAKASGESLAAGLRSALFV